ncbi:MAG TPA: hypothetical protein VM914_12680, partial [Pyrinomonadaceae bacterium]|nr:hypothetical protein [Pyrinomonadaceae bacterium]
RPRAEVPRDAARVYASRFVMCARVRRAARWHAIRLGGARAHTTRAEICCRAADGVSFKACARRVA